MMKRLICAPWACLASLVLLLAAAGAVTAQEKTEAGTVQFNLAVALQNRGLYDEAAKEWTTFITGFQNDARVDRAYHYLGVCYLQGGQLDKALQCFETVVKTYPKFDLLEATYLHLGETQFKLAQSGKAGLYEKAAASFDSLLKNYPQGKYVAQAMFRRGDCLYHAGNKQEAARVYGQVVEKYPEDKVTVDAHYALGVTQEELDQPAAAGATYDAFIKKYPKTPLFAEVIMRRGETLFAAGHFEAAADWFATAAGTAGFKMADHAMARQAASLAQAKKYAEAAAIYAALPGKFPHSTYSAGASLSAGKCYYLAGNYAAAREALARVSTAGGESAAEAAHWLCRSLLKENKPGEAAAAVEKHVAATTQGPMAAQLRMDQADAVYEIPQRRGEAAELYAAVAAKHPQDALAPQALYMAAFTALGQRDFAAAAKHAQAFLTAYSSHELVPDVTYIAAEGNAQLGKYPEAEKFFVQALQKHGNHPDADSWKVRRGVALFLQKNHAAVVAALQPVIGQIRNADLLAEAHYLVGRSQAELGQFAEAAKSLEAAMAAQPKWRQADETLLLLAQAHKRLNRADKAAVEYQELIDKWPQSSLVANAMYGLGWVRLEQNDHAAAETVISALVEKFPGHKLLPRARYGRGLAREQLGKFAPAIEDVQALLAADPTPAEKSDARYVLGRCQMGLKKSAEAVATFETLLKEDSKYADADKVLYELAWALKAQNREKESAEAFARLGAQYRDSTLAAESQFHVGEAAFKTGDFTAASRAYHAAMETAVKRKEAALGEKAAYNLGLAYYRLDKPADAQQTFSFQRETWPSGPLAGEAAFMEAECLWKQKKYKEALTAYEAVSNLSSKEFQALVLLHSGEAAGKLKQWEKSQGLLDRCVREFSDSPYLPEALCEQGWAQQNLGKMDAAIALYEQAVTKGGPQRESTARAQFLIGEVQFGQKKYSEAIKSYFRVAYGYGFPQWQAEAMYEAARCFEALGMKPQALKQYQELIDKHSQSDKVPQAKERAKVLQE